MSRSKRTKALAISRDTKDAVFARDKQRCVWCMNYRGIGLPEAHFIPRSKGGLGIEENILTLCRPCHNDFDQHRVPEMRGYFRSYLKRMYPDWDESDLYYRKD